MSPGPEGKAALEYEWLSITESPVPWPFKVTAFNGLKSRISCKELGLTLATPRTQEKFGQSIWPGQYSIVLYMSVCFF